VKRREFITLLGGAAAVWPLAARGQQPERMRRIGVLMNFAADDPEGQARITAFLQALRQSGWADGRNVRIDTRWAASKPDNFRNYAAELVTLAPDVILASAAPSVARLQEATRTVPIVFAFVADPVGAGFVDSLARPGGNTTGFMQFEYSLSGKWLELLKQIAKAVTTTIPIVFVSGGDPVKLGFVTSLNRPGGNITGASFLTAAVAGKRLELLRDLIPTAAVIDYLVNPDNALGQPEIAEAEAAARTHGLKLNVVNVVNERGEYDFDQAFATIVQHRPDALFVGGDPVLLFRRRELVPLVTRYMIPAIYNQREYVLGGGLMSYGTSIPEHARQQGVYVGRILKGEKPGDLPVTQSTRFELVINLNTAKMLGLKVPLTLQVAADEVIE
jgi:putative tryptophan/tyrosine transport system substrate-binding protein